MEGNKFIFFNSVLSALLEIGHGNVKENLREYYFMETRKNFLNVKPQAMPYTTSAVI
jgi:hypothetical protein